jgi:hypothetical protein
MDVLQLSADPFVARISLLSRWLLCGVSFTVADEDDVGVAEKTGGS